MLRFLRWISEKCFGEIVRQGVKPKHIVLIADGARRFGIRYDISVRENHEIGLYNCMVDIVDWCLDAGIPEYSILMYAFGNYYRPKEEVDPWISVLRLYLRKLIRNKEALKKKGIRFHFYGKWNLIPSDIVDLMAYLMTLTKSNNILRVNMAMGYTGKHDMAKTSYKIFSAVKNGKIELEDVTKGLFSNVLLSYGCHEDCLCLRTSGYKRISNFLTWQVRKSCAFFSNKLWPEFTQFDFFSSLFYYQRGVKNIKIITEDDYDQDFKPGAEAFIKRCRDYEKITKESQKAPKFLFI